jgi:hypothetical protein
MKTSNMIVVLLLGIGLLAGCGVSTETLTKQVRASIEETWAKDHDLKNLRIKSFMLVHKSGNQYAGVLEADADGEALSLNLDVVYDGKTFVWKVLDGTRSAVAESSDTSGESQKARNIAEVEKAKGILTLPADAIPGAMNADSSTVISSGEGLKNLLSILQIDSLYKLTVSGKAIDIGDLNGNAAHY